MLTPENWRSDPIVVDMFKRLGAEMQWWTCDCGAHWLEDHCGLECLNNHFGRFCNWPPEMLKYWDIWNWRARTPPVDYPDLPVGYNDFLTRMLEVHRKRWPPTRLVKIDYENKIAYFNSTVEEPKS